MKLDNMNWILFGINQYTKTGYMDQYILIYFQTIYQMILYVGFSNPFTDSLGILNIF